MGLRFKKSIKIAPGIRLNLGKKSAGLSFGVKGLRHSINTSGRRTSSVGIPGTGLSYTTSSGGRKRTNAHNNYSSSKARTAQLAKERAKAQADKEKQKQLDLEYAKSAVEEYQSKIDAITSIHKECDDFVDWNGIATSQPPFDKNTVGPKEQEARATFEKYKPGFFAKKIKFLDGTEAKRNDIEKGRTEDLQDYEAWENLNKTAKAVLEGDIDCMLEVIEEMAPLDDLVEFGSGFEIGFIEPAIVEVEFEVMADNVVPEDSVTLTATGKLSSKKLSASARLDIMQDYVCSCAIRVARDMCAILPVKGVLIHAKDTFINTEIGLQEAKDILSVYIERTTLDKLNYDLIDPSDAITNLQHRMKFLKTKGFQPIERL